MADGGASRGKSVKARTRPLASNAEPPVSSLGSGKLDFSAMLAIADILPVMVCTLDRERRYRFVNRPYAEWMERPRSALLGRPLAEVIGAEAAAYREPMIKGALAGEAQHFVVD